MILVVNGFEPYLTLTTVTDLLSPYFKMLIDSLQHNLLFLEKLEEELKASKAPMIPNIINPNFNDSHSWINLFNQTLKRNVIDGVIELQDFFEAFKGPGQGYLANSSLKFQTYTKYWVASKCFFAWIS